VYGVLDASGEEDYNDGITEVKHVLLFDSQYPGGAMQVFATMSGRMGLAETADHARRVEAIGYVGVARIADARIRRISAGHL